MMNIETTHEVTRERLYWTVRAMIQREKLEVSKSADPMSALTRMQQVDLRVMEANAADSIEVPAHHEENADALIEVAHAMMLA